MSWTALAWALSWLDRGDVRRENFPPMTDEQWEAERPLSSSERLLLLLIAEHYNDDARRAWPSAERLVERSALSRATVFRALAVLESRGLVAINRTGRNNVYSLPFHDGSDPTIAPKRVA